MNEIINVKTKKSFVIVLQRLKLLICLGFDTEGNAQLRDSPSHAPASLCSLRFRLWLKQKDQTDSFVFISYCSCHPETVKQPTIIFHCFAS
jgi:hypothetical protein